MPLCSRWKQTWKWLRSYPGSLNKKMVIILTPTSCLYHLNRLIATGPSLMSLSGEFPVIRQFTWRSNSLEGAISIKIYYDIPLSTIHKEHPVPCFVITEEEDRVFWMWLSNWEDPLFHEKQNYSGQAQM